MSTNDRALGCFIGLAVGDALGAPVEFKEVGEFVPVTDYRFGGAFRLPEGYWTDDTSLALCLADSILEKNKIDEFDLLDRFVRWYKLGENSSTGRCFDIGNTTRRALEHFLATAKYRPADDDFDAAGNGSIMRLAPVAIRWFSDNAAIEENALRQGLTTHGAYTCTAACKELGNLLGSAIRGEYIMPKLKLFADNVVNVPNSGYVVDTMIAAKWAVGSTTNFEDAILAAVNLGGDADTIGAVAGQLAGAIYGLSGIKQDWVNRLHRHEHLINIANKLYEAGTMP